VNTNDTASKGPNFLPSIVSLIVVLFAMFAAFLFGRAKGGRGFETIFQHSVEKSRLVSGMQAQLLASAEAEKSAVMAETDAASEAFAAESKRASAAVEQHRSELSRLIDISARPDEVQQLREFSSCWTRYQEVDAEILGLAVENTNLKAQKLSFVPAPAALDRVQTALDKLVTDSGTSAEAAPIAKGAYQVLTAALKIHALESRHIAEPSDAEMDRIEAEMKTLDGRVNDGLSHLSAQGGDAVKVAVETVRAAYADFQKVNTEVLALSRRNSNVRSLAMSLGQKRNVMAECQDHLQALQEAVRVDVSPATR
jgi:hypothetical protein